MNDAVYIDRNAHREVLAALQHYLQPTKAAELQRCACRLEHVLGSAGPLRNRVALAMFGGGKDSSFMTAAARYVQLSLEERHGETFRLRIATNRHAGMPYAVMQNIDRVYRALKLYGDPNV